MPSLSPVEKLISLRKELKLSQRRLAAITGVDHTLIGRIERGGREFSLTIQRKIVGQLNLPNSYFLIDDQELSKQVTVEFMKVWTTLTPNQQQLLVEVAKQFNHKP